MESKIQYHQIDSLEALRQLAEKFSQRLTVPVTIGLSGDLGAGKTTFVRFLAQSLGCQMGVSSPTYALQHEYQTTRGILIEHWDLYRLSSAPEELHELCPKSHLRLVEWPENAADLAECIDISIRLALLDPPHSAESRMVTIEYRG